MILYIMESRWLRAALGDDVLEPLKAVNLLACGLHFETDVDVICAQCMQRGDLILYLLLGLADRKITKFKVDRRGISPGLASILANFLDRFLLRRIERVIAFLYLEQR